MTDRMTDRPALETPETEVTSQPDTAVVPLRRNMDFLRLWAGAGISRFGTTVSVVTCPMLVLWHAGSAAATGAVGFAGALPNLLVQLPAGVLADRWDRRRVLMWCDALRLLAFLAVGAAAFSGQVWVPLVMTAASFLDSPVDDVRREFETNSLRLELQPRGIAGTGLHVGGVDTDLASGVDAPKFGVYEVLADDISRQVKAGLAGDPAGLYEQLGK
ncbi:MFS transporter [Streptomyces griseorubiginosus]|uniref:MFS transporter n=1 Tax=Streptomyces griseorubiginosus TaxID=67304 RepID=UPI0033DCF21F